MFHCNIIHGNTEDNWWMSYYYSGPSLIRPLQPKANLIIRPLTLKANPLIRPLSSMANTLIRPAFRGTKMVKHKYIDYYHPQEWLPLW